MAILSVLFKIEVLISTILVLALLIIGTLKKEELLSETAIARFKASWYRFRAAFFLGILSMIFFILLLTIEMIETAKGAALRSVYPLQSELIKVALVSTLIAVNLINMNILLKIVGSER